MVHTFSGLGMSIALDVESGALHLLDEIGLSVLSIVEEPMPPECSSDIVAALSARFKPCDIEETWAELYALTESGQLFSKCPSYPPDDTGSFKALCLHVAHDCDLRCAYCFAKTGSYGGERGVMSFETARSAVDMLVDKSGDRRNLEIDFFGGEPLLAWDTVTRTVDYVREREEDWGKRFRFTLTTNGLALTDERIEYLNREMDNVVLSLDGRSDIHDAVRRTAAGKGSYDAVLPRLLRVAASRERDYFVRGTFTSRNPDFVDDLLHLADLGFSHLSMEPVVLPDGHPLALRPEDVDTACRAYDRLLAIMAKRDDFSFFHFSVDLDFGPCVYKRLRGCGAGFAYCAVSPEGNIYPCHQFVGMEDYLLGHVSVGVTNKALSERMHALTVNTKPDCSVCWAKYHCSGGCAATSVSLGNSLDAVHAPGCQMQKKRLECGMLLQAARMSRFD